MYLIRLFIDINLRVSLQRMYINIKDMKMQFQPWYLQIHNPSSIAVADKYVKIINVIGGRLREGTITPTHTGLIQIWYKRKRGNTSSTIAY